MNRTWDIQFEKVKMAVDLQSSPEEQGRTAARVFSELNQLDYGGKSSTEIIRQRLRLQGILLIESSITGSQIEGCSFYVGDSELQRPCLFVNNYKTSWFRRNSIIMHELCHAIFDRTSGGEVDLRLTDGGALRDRQSLEEVRANIFAQEALLPEKLLVSIFHRNGIRPTTLTAQTLALLVAQTGVERKTIIEVMLQNEMIDDALAHQYRTFDIGCELREQTDHALSTAEYIEKIGKHNAKAWFNKRFTALSGRKLLLPVYYVESVLSAVQTFSISISRACELLMIDEYVFRERFPQIVDEVCG